MPRCSRPRSATRSLAAAPSDFAAVGIPGDKAANQTADVADGSRQSAANPSASRLRRPRRPAAVYGGAKRLSNDLRVKTTLEAFQDLAGYLAGIPGRKNVIWFSSAFPLVLFPEP